MSYALEVLTHFQDVSELAEGFVDRADEQRLILYGPEPFAEGEVITFAIMLVDGSVAVEGKGRVSAAVDGGEERAPETRFDVVLDGLELGGTSEVVYDRILLARETQGSPPTGEVALDSIAGGEAPFAEEATIAQDAGFADAVAEAEAEARARAEAEAEAAPAAEPEFADEPAEAPFEAEQGEPVVAAEGYRSDEEPYADEPAAEEAYAEEALAEPEAEPGTEAGSWPAEGTGEVSLGELEQIDADDVPRLSSQPPPVAPSAEVAQPEVRPAPAMPAPPPGFQVARLGASGPVLTRPSRQPDWLPDAGPMPEPHPSSGLFVYASDELPMPQVPARPDLDPSMRVAPAPRPNGAGGYAEPEPAYAAEPEPAYAAEPEPAELDFEEIAPDEETPELDYEEPLDQD